MDHIENVYNHIHDFTLLSIGLIIIHGTYKEQHETQICMFHYDSARYDFLMNGIEIVRSVLSFSYPI